MAHGFFYLTDHSHTSDTGNLTGSRLFNGSSIKCWVTRCTMSGQNNLDVSFKPNQDFDLTTADEAKLGSNWNRRKANVQNSGPENIQFTLQGGWDVNNVGSVGGTTGSDEYTLSPWKIVRMANSGHTFFLKGGTALQWLLEGELEDISPGGNHTGSYYIPGSGIPVHVTGWNIEDAAEDIDYVTWNLTLTEDKDTINMSN